MPGVFVPGFDSLPKVSDLPAGFIYASPEYLTTVGARILAGRGLTAADRAGSALVVVITAAMAKALSPGESPLGKCVMLEKRDGPCRVVVGVVADQRTFRLTDRPAMHVFAPLDQSPRQERQSRTTVVRAARGRTSIVADEVRRDLDHSLAGLARGEVSFIEDRRTAQLRPWRLSAALFSAAGILALLVSALGVYSVLSYVFSQRTHEIGVRVALGARGGDIVQLVVREGVRTVLVGALLGVAAALAAGKLVAAAIFGISPRDPTVLIGAVLALSVVAVMASLMPAWRAARLDPVEALRAE